MTKLSPSLLDRLRVRYAQPEYAFFTEVGDIRGEHRADAIAVSMYTSRGLEVIGFECKASRGDWLKELRRPDKADPIFNQCDRFFVVVADPAIVRPEELPPLWGLLVPRGDGLLLKVKAPKLQPFALDRRFLASLCRASHRSDANEAAIADARRAGFEAGEARAKANAASENGYEVERLTRDLANLHEGIASFHAASGIDIRHPWQAPAIGKAVHTIMRLLDRKDLGATVAALREKVDTIDEVVRELSTLVTTEHLADVG